MENLNQSIIKSLDGNNKNLLPFIPYLLQDLWEIGSSPKIICSLLRKNNCLNINSNVLDLGCGKGAVSINIAKEFQCQVHGIDAMPEFIEEAHHWADKYHQSHLCSFVVGDIRKKIKELKGFDLIILGSIGPIFGKIEQTMATIKAALSEKGFVILDDGYIPDNSDFKNANYFEENKINKQIKKSGFKIIESYILDNNFIKESDTDIYNKIKKRSHELKKKYPQKKQLFEDYLENQRIENNILENKVVCVTWLLQKSD